MTTAAQRKASAKYDRNHTRSILFKFNTTSDADILAKLDEVGNKQGYIKELIRENICGKEEVLSVDAIGLMVLPVVQKYGIEKVTLFGSYARGEQTPDSDIDVAVLLKDGITEEMHDEMIELVVDLELDLGITVSVVPVEYDNYLKWKRLLPFYKNIDREGIVIWKAV